MHPTDQELLQFADGELSRRRAAQVASHLTACWNCRARKQQMENAIEGFVAAHRESLDPLLPSAAIARASLQVRLAELPAGAPQFSWKLAAAVLAIGFFSTPVLRHAAPAIPVASPEASLTPGAIVQVDRDQVCRSQRPKNQMVPVALRRRVFEEYGIPAAEPRAYEVDYLITPALGGADDIRNLWPQSYGSTEWNARVKDELEDHLRDLVCSGSLDLATAQRDISTDWIAAYKKYFRTDRPLQQ